MLLNGIINLLKPPGMTSHDAVSALRRITGIKKIGHTGTLDPMATGVLPLCIGKATRIIEYLDSDTKEYRCEMQLGIETDTQDIWGTILNSNLEAAAGVSEMKSAGILSGFKGVISQIPPKYSAIKVDGKRLYEYARNNEEVEIKSRLIEIFRINQIRFDSERFRATFDVHCSKGTYVRTICRDAGILLGCGASMSFLSRMSSGSFFIEDTVTIEDLEKNGVDDYIKPIDFPLNSFQAVEIPSTMKDRFGNGMKISISDSEFISSSKPTDMRQDLSDSSINEEKRNKRDIVRIYCCGEFLGMAAYDRTKKILSAEKVLYK